MDPFSETVGDGETVRLVKTKKTALILLAGMLLLAVASSTTRQAVAAGVSNAIGDPGFEALTSNSWLIYPPPFGNGTASLRSTMNPHSGTHSAMLSAINKTLLCSSECKDTVRATVTQYNLAPTLDNLASDNSFTAWWYVAPSTLPPYSLHVGLQFSDGSSIEYWYGHSDLANSTGARSFFLGNITVIGSWFEMSRRLALDIQGLVANPSTTKVSSVWLAAFGGSYQNCSTCPSRPHGEEAWLDDVSMSFNVGPVPVFSYSPALGTAPLTVKFDATQSRETPGSSSSIISYQWTFGDGGSGTGITVSHIFNGSGTFNVTLTVTDGNGFSSSASSSVRVGPGDVTLPLLVASGGGLLAAGLVIARMRRRSPRRHETKQKSRKH